MQDRRPSQSRAPRFTLSLAEWIRLHSARKHGGYAGLITRLEEEKHVENAMLVVLTYAAYIFITVMYGKKVYRFVTMPPHLRWDLYPVQHEPQYKYGGSRYEDMQWWLKSRPKRSVFRCFVFLLKDTFYLGEYFHKSRSYWLVLFPWHVGFILIITFHILCFLAAVLMVLGVSVAGGSTNIVGMAFYYSILLCGVCSFTAGALGSIGMFIKRVSSKDFRDFASPINYFSYLFTLVVFVSGLYAWWYVDPTFSEYREFWTGVITFSPKHVDPASVVHIVLFDLFLFYLPLTRSMHYISRFFAFFWVYWDDEPNAKGGEREKKIQQLLDQPVGWSAPHIQTGKKWTDLASGMPSAD